MVEFLRTNGVASKIDKIIIEAKESIILISPYLDIPQILHERLLEKAEEGVSIVVVYGKDELYEKQIGLLNRIRGISVYYLKNLHAKCYVNEGSAIVTSMNLYEFSLRNNREMGIFFTKKESPDLYTEISLEINSIIKASIGKIKKEEKAINLQPISKINLSYNERLFQNLVSQYPYLIFQYKQTDDSIECLKFGKYFRLEIIPKYSYYRINFAVVYDIHMPHIYDILYLNSRVISENFPENVLNWGNQMKRIKLDFPMNYTPGSELPEVNTSEYLNWIKAAKEMFESIIDNHK